jgi:hypothetical protein
LKFLNDIYQPDDTISRFIKNISIG